MESKEATSAPWRPRKYVLVGMGIILGASALTIVTSIILQPACISFSAADFYMSNSSSSKGDANHVAAAQQLSFAFDLTSHNPSRRAGVEYSNVLVSVQMKHEGKPSVRKTSAPAIATGNFSQPSNSDNTFRVETLLDNQFYGFYSANASATITVYARARFKYGLATTRRYNIRVSCEAVLMHNRTVNNPSQIAYCSPR